METLSLRYNKYLSCNLSNVSNKNGVYCSQITDLSLNEFMIARNSHCEKNHLGSCSECSKLISAAKQVNDNGIVPLKTLFTSHFLSPNAKYKSDKAIRRIIQLPVVIFPLQIHNGQKKLFVTEQHTTVNYEKVGGFVKTLLESKPHTAPIPRISKETLKVICDLASPEKDKRLIKYAVCQSSNISAETAKKTHGIST